MYCKFYGFKERPFNVTSDPAFFFLSRQHKEALSHLTYGTAQRKGILAVTGEIGTGKTTLCRFFLNRLPKNVKTAFILNPYFSEIQLLEAIVNDFGIKVKNKSRLGFIWELNHFLLRESEAGNNVVLIIDEAQNLKPSALEQVRLLSNLETEKDKLLQIILMGQPELNSKLDLYDLRQLKQRIMVRYHITPLENAAEAAEYVNHRLSIAGSMVNPSFTQDALKAIFDFSGGVPRLINVICDRALLAGFVAEAGSIGIEIIERCITELSDNKVSAAQ
ncbi:MAG: AAA family ATPase [Candidatus Omnitrophica bacterium]|nr:AAA family ATPase [Candidatus Omnitrophota bacterium]